MHAAQRLCHLRRVQVEVLIRSVGCVPGNSPPTSTVQADEEQQKSRVWIVVAHLFFLTVDVCVCTGIRLLLRWKRD